MSILTIPSKYVSCQRKGESHQIDTDLLHCTTCLKTMAEIACKCHEKCYSHNVEQNGAEWRRIWICRVCLTEGSDPFPDALEYATLRGKKLRAVAGQPAPDSPRPRLADEYPRDRK